MARERKKSANKSVQSDRNTFLNLFYFQHDAVERPSLLIEIHTRIQLPYNVQPHLVCVYCSLSKCENYTIAKSTKTHCVVVESAYYLPSVGIQASWVEYGCVHLFLGKNWWCETCSMFFTGTCVCVCVCRALAQSCSCIVSLVFCPFVCKVCRCILSISTTLAYVHYTNDRCARSM